METEDQKKLLEDVFGESSSSDSDTYPEFNSSSSSMNLNPNWLRIESINGLWLCTNFLSPTDQSSLLSAINSEGWFTEESHNQAMRFGDLPSWAVKLSDHIYKAVCIGSMETDMGELSSDNDFCILPSRLLQRDPLFDQLIINVYQPGPCFEIGSSLYHSLPQTFCQATLI